MGRTANPRGAGTRLRDELLDAATRLLDAGGRDAVLTLRGVAREAGGAAPRVYPHLPDLHAPELGLSAGDDLLDDLLALLRTLSRPPADAARAAVAVWSGLHGVVSLRTAKPAYPWPPLDEHVDAVLAPYL